MGLRALEFYDPKRKKHGQAHMQARLVSSQKVTAEILIMLFSSMGITQFLIKSGIARLEEVRGKDNVLENVFIRVDKEKVLTTAHDEVGKLLVELQVRKSTADGAGARAFYTELTTPLPGWEGEIRDLVIRKKQVYFILIIYVDIY